MEPTPRHWAHVTTTVDAPEQGELALKIWGWSRESEAEALERARDRMQAMIQAGIGSGPDDLYYAQAPGREEVLESVIGEGGSTLIGEIVRNRYAAQVLATDAVFIADIDVPEPTVRTTGLFRKKTVQLDDPEADARARIEAFIAAHPGWGIHVHRTFGGFRVLVTGTGTSPKDPESQRLLDELGSDLLYTRLCIWQGTHRARLTPKPWRVGMPAPSIVWPIESEEECRERADLLGQYEDRIGGHAVCRRESWNGIEPETADERRILELHDRLTGADSGLPLA